jgi:hypothetical protein
MIRYLKWNLPRVRPSALHDMSYLSMSYFRGVIGSNLKSKLQNQVNH